MTMISPVFHRPDIVRRRLLTAMLLAPWCFPLHGRSSAPEIGRIVALEWLPVELLMALGVTPFGVADVHHYRQWVNAPVLPDNVIDVGLRTEPNLELLARLRPSLLLYSAGYGPSPEQLSTIAPSLSIAFSDGGNPLQVARASLVSLAATLGLGDAAERHLTLFAQFMQQARIRLQPYTHRPLLMFSVVDDRHVVVIGKNSLFQNVLDQLDIENAWQGETNFWGSAVVGIEQLATVSNANAICFDHGNDSQMLRLAASPLWQAMPFIRARRCQRVEPVWFYGATLSAMRLCRVLERAMENAS
ncbi:Fe(3+)-hydroxamate ABC transporter substrate-binding protein FhuD [Musicola paradisiaca]|uniref:Periplasmic binding protein n=1 Tax=Musicola paradisiaca (strain Ech703) TaxID=579405 RepID=C6CB62_MUSP7|nr:Fe(3+)-hydroxamate ABC transporter substrate-binding protein FhuD [Musicola paradisiaca]ACS86590.1 periplasmic binding protein [Musicola paradisiaca Ech703]